MSEQQTARFRLCDLCERPVICTHDAACGGYGDTSQTSPLSHIAELPEPVVRRRECGGWLATSPAHARFRIGETGATKTEAVERWCSAWHRWWQMLESVKEQADVR